MYVWRRVQNLNLNRNRCDNKRVESRVDTVSSNNNTFFSSPAGYLRFGTPRLDDQFRLSDKSIDHSPTQRNNRPLDKLPCCTSDALEIDLPRPIRLAARSLLFLRPTDLLGNFHTPFLTFVFDTKKEKRETVNSTQKWFPKKVSTRSKWNNTRRRQKRLVGNCR